MADKVKPENMTDEAWAHKLARCWFVTEDRNRHQKANKVALNARQAATSGVHRVVRCQQQYSSEERH
jgi:hypothetical protein